LQAPFMVQDYLVAELGPPAAVDGQVVVWDLQGWTAKGREISPPLAALSPFAPTTDTLSKRTWPLDDMPAYERHLRESGRIPDPPPPP
jgi:hypothetical protein